MPGPELRLQTLRRATEHFRNAPGRRGRVVQLQDVDEVLVAGDLHGNLENFRRLLHKADLAKRPRRHLVVQELIHGPYHYPTGGDKSHQLVELIAALACQHPRQVHYLLGNHELAQMTNRRVIKNEGDLNALFLEGVRSAHGANADAVYAALMELFAALPVALRAPNRVWLSHSLSSAGHLLELSPADLERESAPADLRPGGAVYALVWGRDYRAETAELFLGKVGADLIITGHVPCESGFAAPNDRQLVLDSLGSPASYCLFPTDHPLTHAELLACVHPL
jgi:hypothetical protein